VFCKSLGACTSVQYQNIVNYHVVFFTQYLKTKLHVAQQYEQTNAETDSKTIFVEKKPIRGFTFESINVDRSNSLSLSLVGRFQYY
jgi:hypothetical protein